MQNGASYCTTELAVMKNKEIHTWDRGYDDDGNQVSFVANSAIFLASLSKWVTEMAAQKYHFSGLYYKIYLGSKS